MPAIEQAGEDGDGEEVQKVVAEAAEGRPLAFVDEQFAVAELDWLLQLVAEVSGNILECTSGFRYHCG